jgi:signal recognition particle subunit SRP19
MVAQEYMRGQQLLALRAHLLPLITNFILLRSLMCLRTVILGARTFAQMTPFTGRQGEVQPSGACNIIYKTAKIYHRVESPLKDYDHQILWLDYFNKNLKRRQGRRVNHDRGVFDPTIQELAEAARAAGLQLSDEAINSDARFPRRSFTRSGYVMVAKKDGFKKSQMIDAVADKLLLRRRSSQKAGRK